MKRQNLVGTDVNSYFLTNVNIIPMTSDTVLANTNIKIVNGLIESIGDSLNPESLAIFDGTGKFLSPGLIDMHVHVWDEYELGLYLANGVTAIRNLWGQPMHLRMKQKIAQEEIISPLFFTATPKLTGPQFIGGDNLNLSTPEEARQRVISFKARGYDFIKTYYGLTEELFDAILEQAEISGIDIAAHPTHKVPYNYHFNPQIVTIEHAEEIVQQPLNYQLDTANLQKIIAGYVANPHATLTPTLIVYYNIYTMLMDDNILSTEPLDFMNPLIRMVDTKAQFDRWSNAKANDPEIINAIKEQHDFHLLIIKKLHEEGVNIVCGTDAGIGITTPGYSIHQELAFYRQAGMTDYEALRTATINPTKTHDFLRNLGSIENGKIANLLLTNENPLENIKTLKTPAFVMVKGRLINNSHLGVFEKKARNRSNLIASALRYAENLIIEK